MGKDSNELVKHCDKCQQFHKVMTNPPEELSPMLAPRPFAQWGVDIIEPLAIGKGGCKFVVVINDYFTKLAEAEVLATITTRNVRNFLWKSVVCRYEIPHAFVTNNGKEFNCEIFWSWCTELHIRNYFLSPRHPQGNGQVEATNKTLMKALKKKHGWNFSQKYCGPTRQPFELSTRETHFL